MADTKIKYVSSQNLSYYDQKIKAYLEGKDNALKTNLEGQIGVVAGALDEEITRAKGAEGANASAAQSAQSAAEAAQAHSEALSAKVGTVPADKTVVQMIADAKTAATYDDTEVRGLISGLDTNKADKTQVATDIAAAVKAEEDARKEAVTGVQNAVNELSGTVASNKTAIEGTVSTLAAKVEENETDIEGKMTALTNRVAANETAVGTTLPNAINTEKAAREAADSGLDTRLKKVETFFELEEGKTLDAALDTLVELQTYLNGEGEVADQMLLDIAANTEAIEANAKAIEDHTKIDHDFATADASLKSELEGKINAKADASTVSAMDKAYKDADTALKSELEGKINAKADASALSSAVSTLEAADEAVASAAAADATSKANKALDDAKSYANTELGKDRARLDALELIDHEHSNKDLLDTYDQTNANIKNAVDKAHEHTNKTVLDGIDAAKVANWNTAFTNNHTHANKTVLDGINEGLIANWNAAHTFTSNMEFVTTAEIDAMFA